jgi:peptidyl-prolyl cis-trans isomerase A (cyclophilin A)
MKTITRPAAAAFLAALGLLAACGQQSQTEQPADLAAPLHPAAEKKVAAAPLPPANPALLDPSKLTEKAPDMFTVKFKIRAGVFFVQVKREWAPHGADRFYNLVKNGYYDGVPFFRVVPSFMVQFGISGDPRLNEVWRQASILDDPNKVPNKKGYVTFATAGPNTRTTQIFINFSDNTFLDSQGFSPFGQVTGGMDAVERIYSGYGEGAPQGRGPDQGKLQVYGSQYLKDEFPLMDPPPSRTPRPPKPPSPPRPPSPWSRPSPPPR